MIKRRQRFFFIQLDEKNFLSIHESLYKKKFIMKDFVLR